MHNVVDGLLARDGIDISDTQEQRDADYAKLMRLYNDAKAVANSVQLQQPPPSLETVDKAIENEQQLLSRLLAFETVKSPPPSIISVDHSNNNTDSASANTRASGPNWKPPEK